MNETIKNNYGIYPLELIDINEGYFFYYNDYKYYFYKCSRSVEQLQQLFQITNDIYNSNYLINTFVITNNGSMFVSENNVNYVLLRVNMIESDTLSLKDIIYFNNLLTISNTNSIKWSDLWCKKIDDLEEELSTYMDDYPLVENSIDYYIGLAENAIAYFNDTFLDEDISGVKINLNHYRVLYTPTSGYINNPLNITFDYEVRDIGEYLKSKVINGESVIDDLYYIRDLNMSVASIRILYSRLLYPSFYFDLVEKIITNEIEEDSIKSIISKISVYEMFLKDFYEIMSEKMYIPRISWLFNKTGND